MNNAHKGIVRIQVNKTEERTFYEGSHFSVRIDKYGPIVETATLTDSLGNSIVGMEALVQAARLTLNERR